MQVVVKEPLKNPVIREIDNTLTALQGIVGGYIERAQFYGPYSMIVNEEGKLFKLPYNFLHYHDIIVGTVIFVTTDTDGEFKGLTDEQAEQIVSYFSLTFN